ncbi:unnamed protein product [Sphenostylis stenocarpa]|uniref:Uncharacterized protein n=1 Tax=Sphenostylis stenocarpa TaxID=92480 RepID=A0AA86VXZ9_9FABA|nr:unnamed protein product [Sphenostylis stenocarpa]
MDESQSSTGNPSSIMFLPTNTFHLFQCHTMNIACNPTSMKEGHSNPITIPFYGILTPSLDIQSTRKMMDALHACQRTKVMCGFSQTTMLPPAPPPPPSQPSSSKSSLPFSLFNKCELVMSECHLDTNKKVNVEKDTNFDNNVIIKRPWTPEEDSALVELVNRFGAKKWSQVATLIRGRTGKQCRERWKNHLQPNIRKESWSLEEDMILIKAHQEFGTKWSKIAKRLCGRTENAIKNHWNATKRRQNCMGLSKNNHAPCKGSILHAYVKWVTATEQSAKVLKKSSDKKKSKVLKYNCDELALFSS